MKDYISKEEFIKALVDSLENCTCDNSATKCGEWEAEVYEVGLHSYTATCSVCGYESTDYYRITANHKFCENCGARMIKDGEKP